MIDRLQSRFIRLIVPLLSSQALQLLLLLCVFSPWPTSRLDWYKLQWQGHWIIECLTGSFLRFKRNAEIQLRNVLFQHTLPGNCLGSAVGRRGRGKLSSLGTPGRQFVPDIIPEEWIGASPGLHRSKLWNRGSARGIRSSETAKMRQITGQGSYQLPYKHQWTSCSKWTIRMSDRRCVCGSRRGQVNGLSSSCNQARTKRWANAPSWISGSSLSLSTILWGQRRVGLTLSATRGPVLGLVNWNLKEILAQYYVNCAIMILHPLKFRLVSQLRNMSTNASRGAQDLMNLWS